MDTRLRLGKRYQLIERIGSGGMGIVYHANDRLLNEEIALKSLRFDNTYSDLELGGLSQRMQLANEFKWLASLRHPNIVSVIDYGFDLIGQPFFTMELLKGYKTIVDACENKPLDYRLSILGQVLHALAYLHRRNVIHRDLKNGNVLVKQDRVKLLDFGLVALRGQETQSDFVVGTLAYMPPETLMGEAAAESADLYSFGVLAYYTLIGRLPFQGQSPAELTTEILLKPVDFSDSVLPEALQNILARLLARSPEERYTSAHEVILALNQLGANIPVETQQIRESYLKAADFVGRKDELQMLKMALSNDAKKRTSAWLIAGESGIGKSRLIQELRTFALTKGCVILEAAATLHKRVPYQLWHDILRRLRLETNMDEREQALVDNILGAPTNPLENLLARITNLLVKHFLSQDAILLILEDIHWADEASLELLRQLLIRVEQLPVILIASNNSDEAPQLRKELGRIEELRLERFNRQDVQELTESILGETDSRLLDLLMQETEGNVYFLVEVLRTLGEQAGSLADVAQNEWQSRIITGGIRGLIDNRLKRIPDEHIDSLQIAALIGRTIDKKLMARMSHDLEGFLQACESAAILQVSNNEWIFSHNKMREILEENILPSQKIRFHQQILLQLEDLYGEKAAAQLAYHSREAQDTLRELKYSIFAADAAFKVFSLNDAIVCYQRALSLSDIYALPAAELSRIFQSLGRSYELANQFENAEKIYQAEFELGERRGLANLALNAQVNFACLYNSPNRLFHNGKGRYYISEGLNQAKALGNQREEARLYWASMLYNLYSDANTLRAVDDGLHSLRLAQNLGDERLLAFTLHDLSRAYLFEADFERGRTLMEKAAELWQMFDHIPMLIDAYSNLAILHTFLGNYEQALILSKKAFTLAGEIDSLWGRSTAATFVGTIYMEQGNLSAAVEALQQCLDYCTQAGNHLPLVLSRSELALAYLQQNDPLSAFETASLALEIANEHPHYHRFDISPKAVLAYCYLLQGNHDDARLMMDSIHPVEFSFMHSPSALRLIAETQIMLALHDEDHTEATNIAEYFLAEMQRLGLKSQLPHAHRLMAEVFRARGMREEALEQETLVNEHSECLKIGDSLIW